MLSCFVSSSCVITYRAFNFNRINHFISNHFNCIFSVKIQSSITFLICRNPSIVVIYRREVSDSITLVLHITQPVVTVRFFCIFNSFNLVQVFTICIDVVCLISIFTQRILRECEINILIFTVYSCIQCLFCIISDCPLSIQFVVYFFNPTSLFATIYSINSVTLFIQLRDSEECILQEISRINYVVTHADLDREQVVFKRST